MGTSGIGAYYGKFGFDFFSHTRGTHVCNNLSSFRYDPLVWLVNPPFNNKKLILLRLVNKVPLLFDQLKRIVPVAKVAIPLCFVLLFYFNPDNIWNEMLDTIVRYLKR